MPTQKKKLHRKKRPDMYLVIRTYNHSPLCQLNLKELGLDSRVT